MSIFTNPVKAIKATITDVTNWFNSLPKWLQNLVNILKSEEGAILSALAAEAATKLSSVSSTEEFVSAAKGIYKTLIDKNVETFTIQHVFSVLNAAVADKE